MEDQNSSLFYPYFSVDRTFGTAGKCKQTKKKFSSPKHTLTKSMSSFVLLVFFLLMNRSISSLCNFLATLVCFEMNKNWKNTCKYQNLNLTFNRNNNVIFFFSSMCNGVLTHEFYFLFIHNVYRFTGY